MNQQLAQLRRRRQRGQGGFTLIELLVVIIILGILAGVVVFAVGGISDKGQASAIKIDARTIQTAEEVHCAQTGFYADGPTLVKAGLLSDLPTLHTPRVVGTGKCNATDGTKSGFTLACGDTAACSTMNVGSLADQYVPFPTGNTTANLAKYPQNANVFETLITVAPNYQLTPTLAVGWKLLPPGTNPTFPTVDTWRFYLRPNVTFQNGAKFTATATKIGLFDVAASRANGTTIKAAVGSAAVVDDTCTTMTGTPDGTGLGATSNCVIDFTPSVKNLRVPQQMVHPQYGVEAPGTFAGESRSGAADWNNGALTPARKGPTGTGPFEFVSYAVGQKITVQRNPSYWGTPALLRSIVFNFFPDNVARKNALQAGQVDFVYEPPALDVPGLLTNGFTKQTSVAGAYQTLLANFRPAPAFTAGGACGNGSSTNPDPGACHDLLTSLSIRQAIAKSIDRADLVAVNYGGLATTDPSQVPRFLLAPFDPMITGYNFDLAGAKAMLDADGWTGPTQTINGVATRTKNFGGVTRALVLTMEGGFPNIAAQTGVRTYVQGRLAAIGINLKIVDNAALSDGGQSLSITNGSADLMIEVGNQNDANPSFLPGLLYYTGNSANFSGYRTRFSPSNVCGTVNATTLNVVGPEPPSSCGGDQVFNQAIYSSRALDTTDTALRQSAAIAMKDFVDTKAIGISLAGIQRTYVMTSKVTGFVAHPSQLNTQWAAVAKTG